MATSHMLPEFTSPEPEGSVRRNIVRLRTTTRADRKPLVWSSRAYTMTATAMKTWKTNGVFFINLQIHGEFTVVPSSENMFVAIMVVDVIVEPRRPLLYVIRCRLSAHVQIEHVYVGLLWCVNAPLTIITIWQQNKTHN